MKEKLTKEQKQQIKEERKKLKKELKAKHEGIITEFKKFIFRGNVVDMAVGVIVASAFSKIVTSLTNAIIMPIINWILSNFIKDGEIKTILRPEVVDAEGVVTVTEIAINWSVFIQAIIDFLLIAVFIFTVVKVFKAVTTKLQAARSFLNRKEEAEKKALEEAKAAEEKAKQAEALVALTKANEEKAQTASTNQLLIEIIELLKK